MKFIYILSVLLVFISQPARGQSFNTLLQHYLNDRFSSLEEEALKIDQDALRQNPDLEIFVLLFESNAEKVLPAYERLYASASEHVRYLAAEKLFQYHYARGYYITASEYQAYLDGNKGVIKRKAPDKTIIKKPDSPIADAGFKIQVGAFSMRDNAQQILDRLQRDNIASKIVLKNIGGRQLYCVWVDGKSTLDQTTRYANQIQNKYNLNYRIINE